MEVGLLRDRGSFPLKLLLGYSEAIRHLRSWVSQAGDLWQDILTYPVLKEGVKHSRQTELNLTATLYVCQGSVGFKEGSKTSS